ncbi:hypothetical protein LIA77_08682 [Sarocladium implicatum]|nr:hypothetical protein LIA77_08682 [Sarocladium implicatum]
MPVYYKVYGTLAASQPHSLTASQPHSGLRNQTTGKQQASNRQATGNQLPTSSCDGGRHDVSGRRPSAQRVSLVGVMLRHVCRSSTPDKDWHAQRSRATSAR